MVTWHVDDRPASLRARGYVVLMRLARDKQAFEGAERTRRTALDRQRKGDRPPTLLTRLACRVATTTVGDLRVWTARPRRPRPVARVLYIHGGGYVHPLTADYWRLVRALARTPAEVAVPAYPLAPDATVAQVLPQLTRLAAASTGADDLPTVLMGDSAGGALVIVLAQQLRDAGGPQPAAVVALCPWADATLDEHEVADLEASDPMLAESGLRAAGRWWAAERGPADPTVSPVHGDLSGLPPLHVLIGDRDILRPAVDALAARAEGAGAALDVIEVPSMFHVWMTRAIPEGRRTRGLLRSLVRRSATD
ncbi:alpha/beta hydrolase fold domain-containing protein [Nocardioides sp.]|uniref:alpha/beta hydrolase fold domain-containing protein n=1 Tax=Nocardioides sp. TaxID=35761 RepID=UPI00262611EA|nr:alpha/beta hydrolase fold domain-containing protein [Nocardioides sp.]MDI6909747.1 alpha/beta hydrolase fold domain-containing protein [Nocardioides sp.]